MVLDRVIKFMDENDLDALLVSSVCNYRYISGFTGYTAYLYISGNRRVLLTDSRYTTWAKSESEGFDILEVDSDNPYSKMVSLYLSEDRAKTIGFENQQMLYCDVLKFKEAAKGTEFVSLDGKLDKFRQIKTEDEIDNIRTAEKIGDDAFSYILKYIKPGLSEREIALELEMYMRKNGAQRLSFETIVVSGPNSAMPHGMPGERKLSLGDFVTMDFGCVYNGYCSDMTRTIFIGEPNQRQREVYDTVLKAQNMALAQIREGKKGCEIDKVARDVIAGAGYGEYFGHGLGHSLGLYIHEEPRLSPRDDTVLMENMLVTVEPGIYIPDFGGVRIEDLVVVKKDGYENLTHSSKEKIVIS